MIELRFTRFVSVPLTPEKTSAPRYFLLDSKVCLPFTQLRTDKESSVCCFLSTTNHRTTKMVNPEQQTLQNHFKLHDIKFTNSSNYLASQLDLNSTPTQLNEILAALKTVASKLENLAEQLSAHMTLDDLEPYLQKSADASILVLHYADKISSRQIQRQYFPPKPSVRLSSRIQSPLRRRNDTTTNRSCRPPTSTESFCLFTRQPECQHSRYGCRTTFSSRSTIC